MKLNRLISQVRSLKHRTLAAISETTDPKQRFNVEQRLVELTNLELILLHDRVTELEKELILIRRGRKVA